MGVSFQVHRGAVKAAKGIRQFQKADDAMAKDKTDSAVRHLEKGLDDFASSLNHVEKAADDVYTKAAKEIDQGNQNLRKAIDAYADMVLVDGNPLEDLDLVADPDQNFVLIMKDGKIHKNTLR